MTARRHEETLPEGFNCLSCGAEASFPPWVYAHWDERLTYTCPESAG